MCKRLLLLIVICSANVCNISAQNQVPSADPNLVCSEAWQNYRKADALWKAGWGLFGTGTGLTVGGCIAWCLTANNSGYKPFQNPAFSVMCIGGGTFVASIPCLSIGQVRRKETMKICDIYQSVPIECEEIQIQYRKANNLWRTGWGLFGGGMGLFVGGGLLFACTGNWGGLPPWERDPKLDAANAVGFYTMIAGSGVTIASIPCLSLGQVRRKRLSNIYSQKCSSEETSMSFSLQTSNNGRTILKK